MANTNFASALAEYGANAYLLSVSESGPHTSHVEVCAKDGKLHCWLSRTAAKNVEKNHNISLLWPPSERGGYSMIVNGVVEAAEIDGESCGTISVTKSVFHRPGMSPEGVTGACPADCLPLAFEQSA